VRRREAPLYLQPLEGAAWPRLPAASKMAFEQQYLKALNQVRQWNIDKRSLLLQDGAGRSLLLYRL
jgi:hypothetical protein